MSRALDEVVTRGVVRRGSGKAAASVAMLLLLSGTSEAVVEFRSSKDLADPVLACEPTEIRLVLAAGNAASFVFTVMNSGGKTLDWKVQSCPTWLTLEPRQGSLGKQERQRVTLGVEAKGLRPGLATEGVVAIGSGAGVRPLEIKVGVEVLSAARPVPEAAPAPEPRPLVLREPSGPGLTIDNMEVMAGFGTHPGSFLGVGGMVGRTEFGFVWSQVWDEADWAEIYYGWRKTAEKWYYGGGFTLDFAVSESNGSSNTMGAWYLHAGWRQGGTTGWGVDLRVSPAVMEFFDPVGISVTYGW